MIKLPEAVLLVITRVLMPTFDVVTDWLFGIELITGYMFGQEKCGYTAAEQGKQADTITSRKSARVYITSSSF